MYLAVFGIVILSVLSCGLLVCKYYRNKKAYEQYRHDLYYVSDEERAKREAIQEEFSNIR